MALFTKSYAELSEAFVHHQLAEPQAFGRPDIEEWLTEQRAVIQPDVTAWTLIVKHKDFLNRFPRGALAAIRKNADPAKDLPSFNRVSNPAPSLWGAAEALYRMLPLERVKVYRGEWHVVFDNGTELPVVLVEYQDDPGSCHARDSVNGWEAGDILLYAWKKEGERSLQARLYLCDFLGGWIGALRQKAQSDFDRAVAVSADGTKIVQATEVLVYDDAGCILGCYPGSAFFSHKILRSEKMSRIDGAKEVGMKALEDVVTYMRRGAGCQTLIIAPSLGRSIFITHKNFCPDPLPAPLPDPTPAKA